MSQTYRQYQVENVCLPWSLSGLRLADVPIPTPGPGGVLVKIEAVSLQFRDVLVVNGSYPLPLLDNVVPCSDMAGSIVAMGNEVKNWTVGDRVIANFHPDLLHEDAITLEMTKNILGSTVNGVLGEYRLFPAHSLVMIPEHLSYEEAATLPCAALTAYNALLYGFAPVKAGDTVLIQGTGGVSIFALQFVLASGATAIVISSSDAKLKAATRLGAKHVINYSTTPNWPDEVLRITGGRGVDRVLDVVGNAALGKSIASVRLGGSIDIIGVLGGQSNVPPVDIIGPAIWKQLKIRGLSVGSVSQLKMMIRLLEANPDTTRPVIDKVFPFRDAAEAFRYVEEQKHVGKVVIKIGD
ncbi:Alcohol dehydrogenase superfamily protein [Mycena indigotica]|uniref:Alcohol dehydrogenase superfamily protein n=1 Tax=Mycena indigotica TaxID=2126181 RepID=A0A8H6W5C8_9AGAR|nr:Alcohol dehydrogenase superfamily protein [Mycena indigotica]KAF7303451.1 Alcohol dehydrogenase superfamily protein [Mycena indigotica]